MKQTAAGEDMVGFVDMPEVKTADIFAKAHKFTLAEEAEAAGIYPYFKAIEAQYGGTVSVDGREMVITGSNDYLGLTQDPRLKEAARKALDSFSTSCTGSRFLTGTLTLHEKLEESLAKFLGKESALTFSAGYLGCLSVVSALAGRRDIIYYDRENHASLYDGARLSFATLRKYEHSDLESLEQALRKDLDKPGGRMIVTDGIFSMSGHIAKLPGLLEIAKRYNARLVVDDAHSTGVLGENGRGTSDHYGLTEQVDLIVGTFSKSFASVGGFLAGDRKIVHYVKNHARPFIFTAALPAMQVATTLKALEIMETEPEHQARLWQNVDILQQGLKNLGFDTLGSESPIVPVLIGPEILTGMFWKGLWEEGVFTTPAISPSVPAGRAIIRTSVNANHTPEQLDRLLDAFESVGKQLDVIS
ncbi:MAG: pyridoxal phosphate-dependent aminotransferase family protein [Trueperaceae bacterium]|nr:MAG: pyridoxal phosphate-dependent aminotransferase family protein [Trueperaceae bacterium]